MAASVLEVSRLTDETVKVPTRGVQAGADIDPTTYTGSIAWMALGALPAGGDYQSATWETDATVTPSRYFLLRKATTLAAGDYTIWVKIATGSETVQRDVGILRVR